MERKTLWSTNLQIS